MSLKLSSKLFLLFLLTASATATTFTYTSGPFTIVYDEDKLPKLRILREGRAVWYTSTTNDTLISAAQTEETVRQYGGDFIFSFKTVEQCSQTQISENGTRPDQGYPQVYFAGELCKKAYFELVFQAANVTDGSNNVTHLLFNLSLSNASVYNQLQLTYGCEKDEQFYGFGAQYSKFNMKWERLPLFLSEQGVGRGYQPLSFILDLFSPGAAGSWHTTYTRVPHYITNYQRSLALESLEYAVFDMTLQDSVTIEINSSVMTGRIITGNSPLDLITSYTAFAGRLSPLPDWVGSGAVLGLQGGTAAVLQVIDQVETVWGNVSDVAAVWLQDWTGQRNFTGTTDLPRVGLWWNWEVDSTHYPNWTSMISTLNSRGIKTLTYINCMLSDVSKRGTPYQHNYYAEALQKGYLVRNADGSVWRGYSNSTMVDLSNTEAYQWMVNIIVKNMLATGVCGWMCDFGESIPLDSILKSGEDVHKFHSAYPSVWGQVNADAISNVSQMLEPSSSCSASDVVYFMRSGNMFSPKATRLFWLGDQMVTWDRDDGLATVIVGMLSGGISGYSLTHSDIGGYTAIHKWPLKYIRSKELYLRWCELAAFTVMYRSHLGTLPDENWQFNSDTETFLQFFNMTVVFQSWAFYRKTLMEEAYKMGWPVARHMFLVFSNNSVAYTNPHVRFQFMLGTELLVAPVFKEGSSSVKVFLPANTTWIHVWTNKIYKGADERVEIPAPIGQPCVLYPTGSQVGEQFVRNLKQRQLL